MTTPTSGDNTISKQRLKSFVGRIERLNEEKSALTADIREVYAEAKSGGFDVKVLRKVIAIRKLDKAEREEMESLVDVYLDALGDYASSELGQAAMRGMK